MIFSKMWSAFRAQLNKLANAMWKSDPVAQLQYEYDKTVDQMREGREGLEQYRALVERVTRQCAADKAQVANLEAKTRAYLNTGDREIAGKFALELQKAKKNLTENEAQLKFHEEAYNNNLLKVKHASGKLAELRQKIQKYDADLKMSRAEAELAKLAQNFNFDVTTDFGQIEAEIQDKISLNRAKARVAADLSGQGLEDVQRAQAMEKSLADDALREFETQAAGPSVSVASPKALPAADSSEMSMQAAEKAAAQ